MDGLLVDTEELWFVAESDVMARLGGRWSKADQAVFVGGSLERTTRYMTAATGSSVSQDVVEGWLLDRMCALLAADVPFRPGAYRLLAEVCEAQVPCALVSTSPRRIMTAVLAGIGSDRFTATVAGDEVRRTKPDPEPYLRAAELLGVDPIRCVVLEDSPTGVASAEAAGCVTVAVPSVAPVEPAPRRVVLDSLESVDLAGLRAFLNLRRPTRPAGRLPA